MKKLLLFIFLLASVSAFSQGNWTLSGGKNRWANGLGFGQKDTSSYINASDTDLLVWQYPKYLAYRHLTTDFWQVIGTRGDTTGLGATYVKFTDTASMLSPYAHFQAVVKYYDTSGMLSGYARTANIAGSYVPYIGALSPVNLGSNSLTADSIFGKLSYGTKILIEYLAKDFSSNGNIPLATGSNYASYQPNRLSAFIGNSGVVTLGRTDMTWNVNRQNANPLAIDSGASAIVRAAPGFVAIIPVAYRPAGAVISANQYLFDTVSVSFPAGRQLLIGGSARNTVNTNRLLTVPASAKIDTVVSKHDSTNTLLVVGNANIGSLTVTGDANIGGNLSVTGSILGHASLDLPLTGGILSGPLTGTTFAGTIITNAQPNITSLGTLSTLTVTGGITGTLTQGSQPNITAIGKDVALSGLTPYTTGTNVAGLQVGAYGAVSEFTNTGVTGRADLSYNVNRQNASANTIATGAASLVRVNAGNVVLIPLRSALSGTSTTAPIQYTFDTTGANFSGNAKITTGGPVNAGSITVTGATSGTTFSGTSFAKTSGGTSTDVWTTNGGTTSITSLGSGAIFTPTLTNSANRTSSSLVNGFCTYSVNGNIVTATVSINVTPTLTATLTTISFDLPLSTSTTTQNYVGGGTAWNGANSSVGAFNVTGGTTGAFSFYPIVGTTYSITGTFQYTR